MSEIMSYCAICGAEISQLKDYCVECGTKLTDENIKIKGQIDPVQERTVDQPSTQEVQNGWDYIGQFRGETTLTERLKKSYGKALWFVLAMLVYAAFGFFVLTIGLMFGNQNDSIEIVIVASVIAISFGLFGYFAAFLFAATRGDLRTQMGFFEALGQSFKLIGELALVCLIGGLFLLVGFSFVDSFGPILIVIGAVVIWLFPIASQFHVLGYIAERKESF
jgi:vacuolar-type H+-ATPase subunit I/STV1